MVSRELIFLVLVSIQTVLIGVRSQTSSEDFAGLQALKDVWNNTPPGWVGSDPCGSHWEGIGCTDSRVTSITLAGIGLRGQLSGDIESLSELQTLDLSSNTGLTGPIPPSIGNLKKLTILILLGCAFSGPIPDTIGSLPQMYYLALNSNGFTGPIPPSIGNLSKLFWLDLADNKLTGAIPVSSGTTPGLDMLASAKHFHFAKNQLSGEIPSQLFNSNMKLIHVIFDNNQLTGSIPSTIGLLPDLQVLHLERNRLSGPIPSNISSLTGVTELFLSNNQLTGPLPNMEGMNVLASLDMSNNSFDVSDFPSWYSTLSSLTTLAMENTQLRGEVPAALFSLPQLQTVVLKNNKLNGTLDVGSSHSSQLQLVDMQNNEIGAITEIPGLEFQIILVGNPACNEGTTKSYCTIQKPKPPYSTPANNCVAPTCSLDKVSSPNCQCAYPYTGQLFFRAPSFSDLGNSTVYTLLETSMMQSFSSFGLPVDSVSLSNPTKNADTYLVLQLGFFPSGQDRFNRTGVSSIGFALSNHIYNPPSKFGPFFFIGEPYMYFPGPTASKKVNTGIVIGAAVGSSFLAVLAVIAGIYAFHQKRRAEKSDKQNNPFASWNPEKSSGGVPQLKGARAFTFEEVKKYTDNFSDANDIGSGGYGKVYRGTLPSGQLLAIKRALKGSMQGAIEFKSEIELLSRVHHKNVVSLVGFCFDQGEQMLVYEYIPNGTLKESLSGKSGIRLDWARRLRIALGAARGLQYLHELATPSIIHRDIKSNNILLDERLNAKIADFGLAKTTGGSNQTHITTQVKGTMGYMDPEYYVSQQLTEKSDVYSFGVLLLELVSARQPIDKGKYIVREVQQRMDKTQVLYNIQEIIDPMLLGTTLKGLEQFVDMTMMCVADTGANRPTMGEVVKEIENIMQLAGLNPNDDSAATSASYGGDSQRFNHPYSDESFFLYS